MPRTDGRIEKGQSLKSAISARAWNRAQDAADRVLGVTPGFEAQGTSGFVAPYTFVYAKNTTGSAVGRWGIMAIANLDVIPTSDDEANATKQFQSMPVLAGATPTATTKSWCVAIEPIANGSIGRVAVAGVVQVKLEVTAESDLFAACKASTAELKTGSGGQAFILWKQSGTGANKWGLVRFNMEPEDTRLGTISATWNKNEEATVTQIKPDGSALSPEVTFTSRNFFATVTVPQSATRKVLCVLIGDQWLLAAAECS